jgi:hypothetical protein
VPPLILDLVPSRILVAGLLACHLLAAASLLVAALPLAVTIALGLLLPASLFYNYARHVNSHSRWFIDRLYWSTERSWTLHTADGRERTARLLSSYIHPYLVILSFAPDKWVPRSVILLPDSTDPDAIRRLRVCLHTLP